MQSNNFIEYIDAVSSVSQRETTLLLLCKTGARGWPRRRSCDLIVKPHDLGGREAAAITTTTEIDRYS